MTNVGKNSLVAILLTLSMGIVWAAVTYYTLGLLILAGGVLTIVGLAFKAAKVSFNVFLMAIAFISELWLGDIDFGPFSLRAYLMAGLFLYLLTTILMDRTSLFSSKASKSLTFFYILFMFWMVLCRLAQGNSLVDIVSRMASTHMVGLIIFILLQKFISGPQDHRFLVSFILVAIVFSCVVAILEYAGFERVQTLKYLLRPVPANTTQFFGEVERGVPYGLAASAFALGYQIVIALTILFVLYVFPVVKGVQKLIFFAGFFVLGFTIWVVQERSTLVALATVLVLFLLWAWMDVHHQLGNRKKIFTNFVVLVIFGGLFFSCLLFIGPASSQGINSRLTNLYDAGRIILLRQAVAFGMNNWFFGGGPAMFLLATSSDFNTYYRTAVPHNLFLNALVYYGLPGLTLAVIFCLKLFNDCRKFLRVVLVQFDPLMVGVVFALLAYLLNAQFHNASFVTGDPLMWWLVGIIYAIPTIFVQDKHSRGDVIQGKLLSIYTVATTE
jgi:hypothetical protein